jgi:hypothetical protein
MSLGAHAAVTTPAYTAAITIVAGLIAWIVLDRWHLSRVLDDFGAGISRRSTRADGDKWVI